MENFVKNYLMKSFLQLKKHFKKLLKSIKKNNGACANLLEKFDETNNDYRYQFPCILSVSILNFFRKRKAVP